MLAIYLEIRIMTEGVAQVATSQRRIYCNVP